jgi:hypothetical protein
MRGDTLQSDELQITDKDKDIKKDKRNIGLHFKKLEMIRDLKSKLDDKENIDIESSEEYLIYGLTTCFFENKMKIKKGIIYLNEKEEVSLIFLDISSKITTKIKLSKLSDIILGKKSGNFIACNEKIKNKYKEENCLTMQMKDKKKFYDFIFTEKKDLNIFCLGVISIMEKNIKELNNLKRDIIILKQIWKQYVSDNDKKHLNFEQFSMFLRTISFKWKKKTDEQIFAEIDVIKEGKINFKDFISFYEFLVTGEEFKEIFQKYSTDEDKKYISIRGLLDFMEKEQHLKLSVYDIFQILNKFSKKSKKILDTTGLLNTNPDIELDENNMNTNNINILVIKDQINNNNNNDNININKKEKEKDKDKEKKINKNFNLNSNIKNLNLNTNEIESLQNIYENHSFGKNNLLVVGDNKKEDLYNSFCLSFREFVNFLIDRSYNSIYNYDLFSLHQNMNKPINEYFIHSSHNTYLEGNQMIGNSSIDMYMNCLKNGCRLVELDCWDGKNGPIITHWHFPVNKIELKECLIFIKENAFRKSEYPVIFSIENHCNNFNQEMMAQYFIDVIGLENLFIVDTENPPLVYPSPNDLKRKFIIKCKRKRILGKKDKIININKDNDSLNINLEARRNSNNFQNYFHYKETDNSNKRNEENNNFPKDFSPEINNIKQYNLHDNNAFSSESFLVKNTKNYFKQNSQISNRDLEDFLGENKRKSNNNLNIKEYDLILKTNIDIDYLDKHKEIEIEIEKENNYNIQSNLFDNNSFTNINAINDITNNQFPQSEENIKNIHWLLQKEEIIEEVNSNNTFRNTINEEDNYENLLDFSNENSLNLIEKLTSSKEKYSIKDIKESLLNRNIISNFNEFKTIEKSKLKKSYSLSKLINIDRNKVITEFNNNQFFDLDSYFDMNLNLNLRLKKGIYKSEKFKNKFDEVLNLEYEEKIQDINIFDKEGNKEKKIKNTKNKDELIYISDDINKNISLSSTDFTSKYNKNFNNNNKKTQINKNYYDNYKYPESPKEKDGENKEDDYNNNDVYNLNNTNTKSKKEKKKKSNNFISIERGSLKNINHTGILNNNNIIDINKFGLEKEESFEKDKYIEKEIKLNIKNFDKENLLMKKQNEIDKDKENEIAVKIKYLPENKELKFKNLNVEIKDPPLNTNNNQENDNENDNYNYNDCSEEIGSKFNKYDVYKIKTKKNKNKKIHLDKSLESEISDPKKESQVSQPKNSGKVFEKLKVKYLIEDDNNNNKFNIIRLNSETEKNKIKENKEESSNHIQTYINNNNNNINDEVLTRMQEIRTLDEQKPSTIKIKTIEKMAKIVGMLGVKYKQQDFENGLYLPWECVSISEADFNRYVTNIEERIKIIKFCQKSFIKTYPDVVKRTDSTNQDAILSWASGVQIAALNLQKTDDDIILINKIFFKLNGGSKSGYILKPEILRDPNCEESIKKMTKHIAFKIKFKVLSGFHLHLCFPEKTKITGLYVEVSLRSAYNNEDNIKLITNTIENNYLHPIWISSSVHFEVYDPDLSFIIIKIFSKKKTVVARSVIPVKFMNLGIRIVDLYDNYCSKFENSFLIIKCNKINQ